MEIGYVCVDFAGTRKEARAYVREHSGEGMRLILRHGEGNEVELAIRCSAEGHRVRAREIFERLGWDTASQDWVVERPRG